MILKLTVLMSVACAANLALRNAPAAMRQLIWTLALGCALVLPLGGLYAPKIAGTAFVIHTNALAGDFFEPAKFGWVMAVYGLGVAVFLFRLVLDILAANHLVREARPTSLPQVLVSDQAVVPFAWGRIVVPAGMEASSAVIAHERAHLDRGDVWTSVMARLACAVYWFHPLVWLAASRMRMEADRACDDAVLRSGFDDAGYAENLVEIARSLRSPYLVPGAVSRSQLELRLRHILAGRVNRGKLNRAAIVAAFGIALVVFGPLATVTRADAKIYKLTKDLKGPRLLHKIDPQYSLRARREKIQGPVVLSIVVGTDGNARDIRIKKGLEAGLDKNAVAAVEKWKFAPALKAGVPVNVQATIEVNYRLK